MAEATDLTEYEWLARLGPRLLARQDLIGYWRRYYDGDQDLPAGPAQHRAAYRRFQALARTNLCRLCTESMVHRMQVTGFRDGNTSKRTQGTGAQPDNPVWKLWQSLRLDARQFGAYRKAFSRSAAYITVGPDPRRPSKPRVTIEGPEHVIVETDPADPTRRLAALRLWHDPIARRWMSTLYLPGPDPESPGVRHHWQTRKEFTALDEQKKLGVNSSVSFNAQHWEARTEPGVSLPDVPVIPFLNADEGEEPVAEFAAGIDIQNRVNLTLLNRLTAERYGAFRQRYLTNYVPVIDSTTGLPIAPFNPGADQIIALPPPEMGEPETKIGELQQTDTSQILRAVEADMRAFAATTLTPLYYLPGDLINIGADSIAALDAGHIAKVRQRMALWGESWEEVMGLMAKVAGLDKDLESSEIVWDRPENFQPASVADYASKLKATGIPVTMIAEEIGWSPQRVAELRAELASEAFMASLAAPPAPGQEPGGLPPGRPGAAQGAPGRSQSGAPRPGQPQRPASAPAGRANGAARPTTPNR